jgi:hypothetical protein
LVKQALLVAKKAHCNAATVLATNDYSRKIFVKLGFEILASKAWQDCIYNGKHAFGDVKSEMASAHYLKLL